MTKPTALLTALASLAASTAMPVSSAGAQEWQGRGETWDLHGEARLRVDGLSDFALDPKGTRHGRTAFVSTRLLVGASFLPQPDLRADFELEAFSGQVAGRTTEVGRVATARPFRLARTGGPERIDWILPRAASVQVTRPTGRLALGIRTARWGAGILINDGRTEPPFGEGRQGNVVAGLGGVATPWRPVEAAGVARGLALFGNVDFVIRDEAAHVLRGDIAVQASGGAKLAGPRGSVGVFAALRYQRDREDPNHAAHAHPWTIAVPIDLHGELRVTPEGPRTVTLEAEAVIVTGRSVRAYGEETLHGSRVFSQGALGRVAYDDEVGSVQLDAGFASGDADPRDDVARAFSFHSDHRVGLLLFDQVLPMLWARAADRVADPALSGTPAAGLRHVIPQGGPSNAVYVHPVARVRVAGLELGGGWLGAWAPTPVADLYASAENGGWSEPYGAGDFYGQELLGSARYRFELPQRFAVTVGIEAGLFFAGSALDRVLDPAGPDAPPLGTARGRLDITW